MKKSLHRNVLSCAASPLKLSELDSSRQICYQVAVNPLHRCALLLAEMITINKLSHKMNVSLHINKRPRSPLPMQQTSSQGDKSSLGEQMKETSAPPLLDAPLLHINCSLSEMKVKTPWIYSPCKLQATRASCSSSQGFYSNPHQVRPFPPWEMRPPLFSKNSQVKNESQ